MRSRGKGPWKRLSSGERSSIVAEHEDLGRTDGDLRHEIAVLRERNRLSRMKDGRIAEDGVGLLERPAVEEHPLRLDPHPVAGHRDYPAHPDIVEILDLVDGDDAPRASRRSPGGSKDTAVPLGINGSMQGDAT